MSNGFESMDPAEGYSCDSSTASDKSGSSIALGPSNVSSEAVARSQLARFSRLHQTVPSIDRRQSMPLDAAYFYLRHLELNLQSPDLFKVCNSIKTIDIVLGDRAYWDTTMGKFSDVAWSKVREKLFQILLVNFPGRLIVYAEHSTERVTPGSDWPKAGFVVFYPDKLSRPREFYKESIGRLDESTRQVLKRVFLEAKQRVCPADFQSPQPQQSSEPTTLLNRFYDICEKEAEQGKFTAHHLWHHLESEAKRCSDRHRRKDLRKRMSRLQAVWGSPHPTSTGF